MFQLGISNFYTGTSYLTCTSSRCPPSIQSPRLRCLRLQEIKPFLHPSDRRSASPPVEADIREDITRGAGRACWTPLQDVGSINTIEQFSLCGKTRIRKTLMTVRQDSRRIALCMEELDDHHREGKQRGLLKTL